MPATGAREPRPTPTQKVASLEQTMTSRVSGGCVYILPNELSILVTLAKEGATSLERREALMNALRKQGKFAPA